MLEIKTTSQITQEHKKFLSSINEMPMNIYLDKATCRCCYREICVLRGETDGL